MRFFWFGPPSPHFFSLRPPTTLYLLSLRTQSRILLFFTPPVPLPLFIQALFVLEIRPLRPMAAYEGGGGGIGGKFPKRPFRRAPATPYERPPAAVRPARGHPAETRGNGWLSKLVDPASRIIAWSASRLFSSSVFQKRLGPPPAAASRMVLPLFSCSFPWLPRPQISRLGFLFLGFLFGFCCFLGFVVFLFIVIDQQVSFFLRSPCSGCKPSSLFGYLISCIMLRSPWNLVALLYQQRWNF